MNQFALAVALIAAYAYFDFRSVAAQGSREYAETYHQPPYFLRHTPDATQRRPMVFLNGILQEPNEDYVIQKNVIQWTRQQPATTASVTVVYWGW